MANQREKIFGTPWKERILKRDFSIVLGKMLQSEQKNDTETEEFYLRSANVKWDGVDLSDVKTMWFSPDERRDLLLLKGDLLVNEGGDVGRCTIWPGGQEPFYIQNAINRVRARSTASTKFLYYWLNNLKQSGFIDAMVSRITIAHLTAEKLARIPVPDVPPKEQQLIADYLDASCAVIDKTIETKLRQREILISLHKSLISKVITKGLDEKVEFKSSGQQWLGDIPVHWKARFLKHLIREPLSYGLNEAAELEDRELPRYIRITDFDDNGTLREDSFRSLPYEIAKEAMLEKNDVLFARSGATSGKTFIFRDYEGQACYAGYLICARPISHKLTPQFLYFFTKTNAYEAWKNLIFTQATIQNISAAKYNYLVIPLPSLCEQDSICRVVESKNNEFKKVLAVIEGQISTLIAYRKSLIHECVTGQRRVSEADVKKVQAHGR